MKSLSENEQIRRVGKQQNQAVMTHQPLLNNQNGNQHSRQAEHDRQIPGQQIRGHGKGLQQTAEAEHHE